MNSDAVLGGWGSGFFATKGFQPDPESVFLGFDAWLPSATELLLLFVLFCGVNICLVLLIMLDVPLPIWSKTVGCGGAGAGVFLLSCGTVGPLIPLAASEVGFLAGASFFANGLRLASDQP